MKKEYLDTLSGVLFVLAFVPYVLAILGRDLRFQKLDKPARPSKTSWLIWASLDSIALYGMRLTHTINGQIIGAVLGSGLIAILAMKYGVKGWTRLDMVCLALGALAATFVLFGDPSIGIVSSCIGLFVGSWTTFESAWKDPAKENGVAWTIFWISCVLAMAAITEWTPAGAAQPTTFFVIETIMMYLLFIRPWVQKFART